MILLDSTMKKMTGQKGAAAVEFAIILPVLVMLVFGIIEFSLLLYNKQVITNAAREGARAGIVSQVPRVDNASIEAVVNNYSSNNLVTFGAITQPLTGITRTGFSFGDDLTVTVTYHYDFLVLPNLIADLVGGTDLVAQTVMKME